MTTIFKTFLLVIFCMIFIATTGCSSLSLFSSRHVHYHASEEADGKIDALQARLEKLEAQIKDK